MSDVLTVHTSYRDVSEMAEGLISRVDEEKLMLPSAEPIAEGVMVQFVVLLEDGLAGFEGIGRCIASYDNGEELRPEDRYDVVLDALQLDGRSQVVHERILLARETAARGEPVTGEVSLDEVENIEQDSASAAIAAEHEPAAWGSPEAAVEDDDVGFAQSSEMSLEEDVSQDVVADEHLSIPVGSARPEALSSPPAFTNADGWRLERPSHPASWAPHADPRPPTTQPPSGMFDHGGGLPRPPGPPRPEGSVARVSRAPRPAEGTYSSSPPADDE